MYSAMITHQLFMCQQPFLFIWLNAPRGFQGTTNFETLEGLNVHCYSFKLRRFAPPQFKWKNLNLTPTLLRTICTCYESHNPNKF